MSRFSLLPLCFAFALSGAGIAQSPPRPLDTTAHSIRVHYRSAGVKVEVLDYGGTGRAMVFLAALGPNAHDWDKFAPKFVGRYHVYAISRRGFGASDAPPPTDENYSADRLGDDVLSAMDQLNSTVPFLWVGRLAELIELGGKPFSREGKGADLSRCRVPLRFLQSGGGGAISGSSRIAAIAERSRRGPRSPGTEAEIVGEHEAERRRTPQQHFERREVSTVAAATAPSGYATYAAAD